MTEPFTHPELDELERRASELARTQEDPSLRTALQVLAEAAANLRTKTPAAG